jgi:hypothetical protein
MIALKDGAIAVANERSVGRELGIYLSLMGWHGICSNVCEDKFNNPRFLTSQKRKRHV